MNRKTILEALARAGHGALASDVDALVQPAIFVRGEKRASRLGPDEDGLLDAAMDALPIGASRFGGIPDLPPGAAWPSRDDVPMELVAQLRLADVAPLDPLGRLPARGSLLFFYNSQWKTFDQDQDRACCAVLFHDGPDDALVRTPPPRVDYQGEFDGEPRLAPYVHGLATLTFTPFETVPGGVSPFIAGTPLEPMWQDFSADHSAAWLVEGEAAGRSNRVLGYVDAQDYVDAHLHGKGDQLLLQLDSDDSADFQWGDCDRLYFLIGKDELAARDFAKARLYSIMG